ncbi:hypothetical protein RPALISO_246 [Ruegeria phage RpAliso]|nr:hypothetical protein RPALISO_246 [Ruegeria phage RpAliso]
MHTFVFLLTIWSAGDVPQVYVEDYGLTGEDCTARIVAYAEAHPQGAVAQASCELDEGQPWDELPATGLF